MDAAVQKNKKKNRVKLAFIRENRYNIAAQEIDIVGALLPDPRRRFTLRMICHIGQ